MENKFSNKNLKMAETLGTVHTHTHTGSSLKANKNNYKEMFYKCSVKTSLFVVQ